MSAELKSGPRRRLILFATLVIASVSLLILLTVATTSTRLGMDVAEVFGALVQKIKDNPEATAAISVGAAVLLWICLGALVAAEQWMETRRSE